MSAQQPTPHIGYVYPAGGQLNTSFQVTVGGQFLEGVTNASVSGAGIRAVVTEYTRPITPGEFNKLRDELKELQDKRQAQFRNTNRKNQTKSPPPSDVIWSPADKQRIDEIRKKVATFVRRPANPAIAETATLRISIATNAAPGEHEIRLNTPNGLSNPLLFCVGELPEITKKVSKPDTEGTFAQLRNREEPKAVPAADFNIYLPSVVNGQIFPGGRDRLHFNARQGQNIVIIVNARELIPYLPDAVPGWFQAAITLSDAKGKELAYDDDFRFHPDPVLHFEVPHDGQYTVEIKDAIFRGREDFVYRITIGELPYITSIFPLGGKLGAKTSVELKGWNLPQTKLTQGNETGGIHQITVKKNQFISNPLPFATDNLPEDMEREPNDSSETAQSVSLPVIINGRINKPGDTDVFRFEGNGGQEIVAEVYARRLDSPLDSVVTLTDSSGKQIAANDDHEDKGSGLNTHHADSYFRVKLPASGGYTLHLVDAQHQGGSEYAYRLRISEPQPDFELRVVPSSVNVRGGMSAPLTVYCLRKDGFTNEIEISLKGADGFSLNGARVPPNQEQVRLTLTAPPKATDEPVKLALEGYGKINDTLVIHPAVPAEDMMQAFAYRHLVPAREMKVAVSGKYIQRSRVRILSEDPVKIPVGGTARIRVAAPAVARPNLHLELNDPPDGIAIQKVFFDNGGAEILLKSDAAKTKAGLEGNLIVNIFAGNNADVSKKKAQTRRLIPVGILPAIPFEIASQ